MNPHPARLWPFLLPLAATALVFAAQPGDQLGVCGDRPFSDWPRRLLYDDADTAAYTLRGLNANLGRKPCAAAPPPLHPGHFAGALQDNRHPPLRDRYFLEYPHAALFLFRAVMACVPVGGSWPSTVLDCDYPNIIFHHPEGDDQRQMWTTFRRAARVFVVVNVLGLLGLMAVLRRGLGPDGSWAGPVWLLVLPSSLYFVMCRFDVLPSLCVVLGLAAAGRGRAFLSGFALGAATALKLYPLVIAPLVWRHTTRDARSGAAWAAGFALPLVLVFGAGAALDGVSGVLAPFEFQLKREKEPDWILHGRLIPGYLADSSTARLGVLAAVVGGLFALRPGDMGSLLRRCAAALIVFANLQVFFSPQWSLWFVPLLVPLARRSWLVVVVVVLLDLLTYLAFPVLFDLMGLTEFVFNAGVAGVSADGVEAYSGGRLAVSTVALREVLLYSRGVLTGVLLAWLAWREAAEWRPSRDARGDDTMRASASVRSEGLP